MYAAIEWIRQHEAFLGWLGVVSVLTFVGSIVVIPWLVVRIPSDYFLRRGPFLRLHENAHPAAHLVVRVGKNVIGLGILLAGVAMLLLPGQGILTILLGLLMVDFPGKHALERWLLRRPAVLRSMNWIRAKAHRPPLEMPDGVEAS